MAQTIKNLPAVRDLCSIPGLGRSPREGNGTPLQYSCLENSLDRGSMGSQRDGHDWVTNRHALSHTHTHTHTHTHIKRHSFLEAFWQLMWNKLIDSITLSKTYHTCWQNLPCLPKANQTAATQCREGWVYLEYRKSIRTFPTAAMP